MGEDAKRKCPDCESEMQQWDYPKEVVCFALPFFRRIEIKICKWTDDWYCLQCYRDREKNQEARMCEGAYDVGYEKGFEAGQMRGIY